MRGADGLIAALERAGVDTIFGMPGGASLPLHDALRRLPIRHVLCGTRSRPATRPRAMRGRRAASASRSSPAGPGRPTS